MSDSNTDFRGSCFYFDQFYRISYPYTILFLLVVIISGDFFISFIFQSRFLPEDVIDFIAYCSRLLSIAFAFSALRRVYNKMNEVLSDLAKRCVGEARENLISLKNDVSFLNQPVNHLLAGAFTNALYLILLYGYIFPILKWKPYHVFSNAFWVGVLGIGCYVAVFGVRFGFKFLRIVSFYRLVDLYHEDMMGGLRGVSKLLTSVIVLSSVAIGLWVGSIPYAFKYGLILLILCLGLALGLFILGLIFYKLHSTLNLVRLEIVKENFSIFSEARKIYDTSLSTEERVNFIIKMLLAEFTLTQAYKLRVWPIDHKTVLETFNVLTIFLPITLQYIFYLFFGTRL